MFAKIVIIKIIISKIIIKIIIIKIVIIKIIISKIIIIKIIIIKSTLFCYTNTRKHGSLLPPVGVVAHPEMTKLPSSSFAENATVTLARHLTTQLPIDKQLQLHPEISAQYIASITTSSSNKM